MNIENNSNIASAISASISKLHINTAKNTSQLSQKKPQEENFSEKEEVSLIKENIKKQNKIDVEDIQKYADYMGEKLSIDDINYGLMYGRSVIADYSV